jgi:flagellar hook-associated protein 2
MATSSVSASTSSTTVPTTTSTTTSTKPNVVNLLGAGSGMDVKALAQALVDAEKQPQANAINKKITKANNRISGYSALRYGLTQLQTAFNALNNKTDFNSVTLSNNKTNYFTATANSNATAGNHTIAVNTLAAPQRSQSSIGGGHTVMTSSSTAIGLASATKLQLSVNGGASHAISLSSDKSLDGIAASINAANLGVTADVVYVNASTGYQLVVTGDSGTSNAFTLTSDEPAILDFGVIPGQAAVDASITVDGLNLTRSSNQIDDAIAGVSLNLLEVTDTAGKLSLQRDVSQVKANVQALVSAYNDLASIMKDATDPKSKVDMYGATLVGDSIVDTIKTQVRRMFTENASTAAASGDMKALRNVGITVQANGEMKLDAPTLDTALTNSFSDVVTMFSNNIATGTYVTKNTTAGIAGDAVVSLTALLDTTHGDNSGVLFVNSKNADKQVQNYQDDLQKLSDRMDMLLARYNKQFSAMESIVGESKSLGTSLTSTFAGMSNMYKNN